MSNNVVSSFNIFSSKSKDLCLIDPMWLGITIILICLFLYIIGYKLNKHDYE